MKVLVIGSGAREHALAWKIKQSPLVDKVFCAPGNGGISEVAECVDIPADDIESLLKFAIDNEIGLTVVGPEVALVEGIVDSFEKEGLKIFGPSKVAAKLEGSKVFAKEFMYECNIPTAPFETFDNVNDAKEFLNHVEFPLVVKADGLAAGKGVIICNDIKEALKALDEIMVERIFSEAGNSIVIEECLKGEEASILAVSDGENYIVLDSSQDHKRIFDDDLGPNTGGMGAYSPTPIINDTMMLTVEEQIIKPTIQGMSSDGTPFKGVLYVGVMLCEDGPYVLEYNVRFGDPETQSILPRMKNDLVEVMLASCDGGIDKIKLEWENKVCVCVVMSSGGYPGKYQKGKEINGLDLVKTKTDVVVFHAGTKKEDEKYYTTSGRVLGVTAMGRGIEEAISNVYDAVELIKFDRCFFRRDIGAKALKFIKQAKRVSSRIKS